jgi:hypothetical protein
VQAILRAALAALPANIGGARSEPLDVGRASRVVTPAQRRALASPPRPRMPLPRLRLPADLDGRPSSGTDLDNLVLLCRRHHRAVHEGGWTIHRDHTGQIVFIHRPADRPPPAPPERISEAQRIQPRHCARRRTPDPMSAASAVVFSR